MAVCMQETDLWSTSSLCTVVQYCRRSRRVNKESAAPPAVSQKAELATTRDLNVEAARAYIPNTWEDCGAPLFPFSP